MINHSVEKSITMFQMRKCNLLYHYEGVWNTSVLYQEGPARMRKKHSDFLSVWPWIKTLNDKSSKYELTKKNDAFYAPALCKNKLH